MLPLRAMGRSDCGHAEEGMAAIVAPERADFNTLRRERLDMVFGEPRCAHAIVFIGAANTHSLPFLRPMVAQPRPIGGVDGRRSALTPNLRVRPVPGRVL